MGEVKWGVHSFIKHYVGLLKEIDNISPGWIAIIIKSRSTIALGCTQKIYLQKWPQGEPIDQWFPTFLNSRNTKIVKKAILKIIFKIDAVLTLFLQI